MDIDEILKSNNILDALPIFVGIKDKNLRYIYGNELLAEAAGLDSPNQFIGKTDYDLGWRDQAELYRLGDRRVFTGYSQINHAELQTQPNKIAKILVSKKIVYDQHDRSIGLIGSFVDVSHCDIRPKSGCFDPNTKRFYLGKFFNNEYLTERELSIVKYLLLGYSSAKIALVLKLTQNTVKGYIKMIRLKLQCQTKSDIIVTAMQHGLTYLVMSENINKGGSFNP